MFVFLHQSRFGGGHCFADDRVIPEVHTTSDKPADGKTLIQRKAPSPINTQIEVVSTRLLSPTTAGAYGNELCDFQVQEASA
uniref:Uncharacterized protein n=1 Tax=Steinernema glaseri TaxID=37863 RepID=A0A1I8A537_9BILA